MINSENLRSSICRLKKKSLIFKIIDSFLATAMVFPTLILTLTHSDRSHTIVGYGVCVFCSLGLLWQKRRNWTYFQASCCIYYLVTFALTAFAPLIDIGLINEWALWLVYSVLAATCFFPKYVGAKTFVEQYANRKFPDGLPLTVVRLNVLWGTTFLTFLTASIFLDNPIRAILTAVITFFSVLMTKKIRKNRNVEMIS